MRMYTRKCQIHALQKNKEVIPWLNVAVKAVARVVVKVVANKI